MRLLSACLSLLLAVHYCVAGSAFEALKSLTPEQMQRVALIGGRDGTPQPDRWHILVHDPASTETGLREIVVANGKKVADRSISQFAEKLSANDVFPPDSLKVDSEKIGKIAMKFGNVNNVSVSALHFDLRRNGPELAPLWTVICLDSSGTELGKLIINATKGNVLMHPGFLAEPDLATIADGSQARSAEDDGDDRSRRSKKTAAAPPRRRYYPSQQPIPASTPKPGFLQRLFTPEKPKPPPPR